LRIVRLEVSGFGCLNNQRVTLAPTLNLVVGPNESGKSTLQQAILATLFGLEGAGLDDPQAARWRPWSGTAFAVTLEGELQDSMRVRVIRDWIRGHCEVLDASTRQDLRQRLHIRGEPGPALLGIGRDVFVNTAFISRAEIARIEDPAAMRRAVADLVDAGPADRGVRRALERLEAARRRDCGPPGAREGPLHELDAAVRDFRQRAEQARQARRELPALAERVDRLREESATDDARANLFDFILTTQELTGLEERLRRAEELNEALRTLTAELAQVQPFASFPSPLQPRVLELRTRLDTARTEAQAQRARAADVQAQLVAMRAQVTDLDARAADIEATAGPALAPGDEEEVRRLAASLARVESEIPVARERLQRREVAAHHAEARLEGYSINADWEERRLVFHKGFSQWREQAQAAREARDRINERAEDQLKPLQEEANRLKKANLVLDDILTIEREQPARAARIQRAADQVRTATTATLVFAVLVLLGILVAVYALFEDAPYYLGGLMLAGVALIGAFLAAFKRQDFGRARQRLRRESEAAGTRHRLLLEPFGVLSGTELQRLQIEHLERVQEDAARLEVQRQLAGLDVRGQESATALQRLVASWGLPVPSISETSFQQAAVLIERLVNDGRAGATAEDARVQARHHLDELERQRTVLHAQLREALPPGDGAGTDSELAPSLMAADRFLAGRAARRRLDQVLSQLEQVRARILQLEEPARRSSEADAEAARFSGALADIYRAAGLSTDDMAAADQRWDQGVHGESVFAVASGRATQARAELARILGGESLEALQERVTQARTAVAALPTPPQEALAGLATIGRAEVERLGSELRQRCEGRDRERLAAEQILKEAWERLPAVAPLEEDLVAQERRLQELTQRAAAYDLAAATLETAGRHVRRDIARGLTRELTGRLATVTEGRYVEAILDEELGVRVRSASGRLTRVETLSQGTRNLIYLLERLALAQWISATKEPLPLLLDDALVYCDKRRLDLGLGMLEDLGRQAQIILFTKDETLTRHPRVERHWKITELKRGGEVVVDRPRLVEAS
jgi:DNA repair exonuclease SbcCD ATPase subunit